MQIICTCTVVSVNRKYSPVLENLRSHKSIWSYSTTTRSTTPRYVYLFISFLFFYKLLAIFVYLYFDRFSLFGVDGVSGWMGGWVGGFMVRNFTPTFNYYFYIEVLLGLADLTTCLPTYLPVVYYFTLLDYDLLNISPNL